MKDELYQLESKHAKSAKLLVNIRWEIEGDKYSKRQPPI